MKFKREFNIRSYNIDAKGNTKLSHLLDFMVDTSIAHSAKVEAEKNMPLDFYWVILQWDIEFYEKTEYGDDLDVYTFTTGLYKYYAYRQWEIYRSKEQILKAKSQWIGLSKKDLKPQRLSEDLHGLYETETGYDIIKRKFSFPRKDFSNNRIIQIRKMDIDTYQHVNNARYFDWISEIITQDIKRIRIYYKEQILYGEEILLEWEVEGEKTYYRFLGKNHEVKAYGIIYY